MFFLVLHRRPKSIIVANANLANLILYNFNSFFILLFYFLNLILISINPDQQSSTKAHWFSSILATTFARTQSFVRRIFRDYAESRSSIVSV
jgi:hypothetical protein